MVAAPVFATPSFPTPQAALDWPLTTDPNLTVYVGGVLMTDATLDTCRHHVGETAVGRLSFLLPRHPAIQPLAPVEVQGGHNDLVGTHFSGFIPNWDGSMGDRGNLLDVQLVGWSELLKEPFREDVAFAGPVAADAVFVALCQLVGIPSYLAEAATTSVGDPLMLGGNNAVDDGQVIIKALQSPLGQFQRLVEPYGYFVTDFPQGPVVFHHVYGLPIGEPVVSFIEGVNIGTASRGYDVREIVNVWDVNGVTYEDEFGGRVPIRSIADPDDVPPHPEIRGGFRYRRIQNSDLVRADQADAVRHRYELDYSAATAPVTWEAVGLPGLNPGDCVIVDSPTVESPENRLWLMGISLTSNDRGYTADYEGWAGAGEEREGIVDRVTIDIQEEPWHGGDEFVSHYAHPAPQGVEKAWTFTLPGKVGTANIRGYSHTWNSQTVGGKDSELTVSRWEVWLHGMDRTNDDNRPESSGTMPHMPEQFGQAPNFSIFEVDSDGNVTNPGKWVPFAINLRTLDAGKYDLVFKCGKQSGYDDGEIRLTFLELFGTVQAASASGGG